MLEHDIQTTFFELIAHKYKALYPFIFAIPNGGLRNKITAFNLKKEGVKAGVSDVFCAIPTKKYHGLWLEFKTKKGSLTDKQKDFFDLMQQNDYAAGCAHSIEEAIDILQKYLVT